jgi:hypothetical protein
MGTLSVEFQKVKAEVYECRKHECSDPVEAGTAMMKGAAWR